MGDRVYFLGIGGTLMGSLAILAKNLGHDVSGSDQAVYPPMSTQLEQAGIDVYEGFDSSHFVPRPDVVVVGNAKQKRGVEAVEVVLERKLRYVSAAEWLSDAVLPGKKVVAVSGTHGKTTTTSIVAWLLEESGIDPGFLVGGVPSNFETSARVGGGLVFVVEADEYDCSYFDRRSKFLHYLPDILIINNLEFDHADIFRDLGEIEFQFHHLLRAVPRNGRVIVPGNDSTIQNLIDQGCWTSLSYIYVDEEPASSFVEKQDESTDFWCAQTLEDDGSRFVVTKNDAELGEVTWSMLGKHNVANALASLVAVEQLGVNVSSVLQYLDTFKGVARRMQKFVSVNNLNVYDDFAHHPTAISTTLAGLRKHASNDHVIAVIEPRTHTMSLGALRDDLLTCCESADAAWWFRGENIEWDMDFLIESSTVPTRIFYRIDDLVDEICAQTQRPTHVVLMSNGSFGGIYEKIKQRLT